MEGSVETNLLVAIRKNANSEEENLTTEAFANLLRQLLQTDPEAGCAVLKRLTQDTVNFEEIACANLSVSTQVTVNPESIPDMMIRSTGKTVVVEVKVDAELGEDQLPRYRKWLDSQDGRGALVLLTKRPLDKKTQCQVEKADAVHVRWFKVALCLQEQRDKLGQPSRYLANQFLEFLAERRMTLEQVRCDLGAGLRSLLGLMDMVSEAVPRKDGITDVWAQPSISRNGYAFKIGTVQCWAGVYYTDGNTLVFEATEFNKEVAPNNGVGKDRQDKRAFNWTGRLDLESPEVRFFAQPGNTQADIVKQFIQDGIETVRKHTTQQSNAAVN